jgi:hypothetical protein
MFDLCLEVQKFISVCEHIQSLMVQGRTLTSNEKLVIEFAAKELLTNMKAARFRPQSRKIRGHAASNERIGGNHAEVHTFIISKAAWEDYAKHINKQNGTFTAMLASGVAGNETTGYIVVTHIRLGGKWRPVTINPNI